MADIHEIFPFYDQHGRYYFIGNLWFRYDDGAERISLNCPTCKTPIRVFYPNNERDGYPFLAVCKKCQIHYRGKRATDLWDQIDEQYAQS